MLNTLQNALTRTDEYVWFSTDDKSWLEPSNAPVDWLRMIETVRKKF
jgi:hypothetical protein